MIDRVNNFLLTLRRRGIEFLWYLMAGYFYPKLFYHFVYEVSRRRLKILGAILGGIPILLIFVLLGALLGWAVAGWALAGVILVLFAGFQFHNWWSLRVLINQANDLTDVVRLSNAANALTEWEKLLLPLDVHRKIEDALHTDPTRELVIGQFDNDGKVLGVFGPLPGIGLGMMEEGSFKKRKHYATDIVLLDGKVLVRKDFAGDKKGFVHEWYCLARLHGVMNVAALYRVDKARMILYKNFIPGRKIRDGLIDAGAQIRDVDLKAMEKQGLDSAARAEAISKRALEVLPSCFSEDFFGDIERQLDLAHSMGITNFGFTINNVIVDQNERPWFFDFEGAMVFHSSRGLIFSYRRDQDRERFNRHYGDRLLTERIVRRVIVKEAEKETLSDTQTQGWYAPIDFGNGLVVGGLGSTETGMGRWEYLNKKVVPQLISGKRVLDLGSNNGLMPLLMSRAGAKEVVGVELSHELVERARLVQRIFEWRDMRNYNLIFRQDDMRAILTTNWGEFDVVTAYCSLYFLQAEDMAKIVQKASKLASVIIIQANLRVPATGDGRTERASLHFLKNLIETNGFPHVEIYAPDDYPRPLLIGKR